MTSAIEIVPARPVHALSIARRMRAVDRAEVWAAARVPPIRALTMSMRQSRSCYTALLNGRPEVMFGVGDISILAGVGAIWLLGTDEIEAHRGAFLRGSKVWVAELLTRYRVLKNMIDCRNKTTTRWLGWLGATFSEPFEWNGQRFMIFELRAGDV